MSGSPAHILLVAFAPFPAPTGIATRLAQRIASLSNAGFVLDVLTPRTASLPHMSSLAGARILRVPMPRGGEGRSKSDAPAPPPSIAQQCAAFERAVRRQLQADDYAAVHLMDPAAARAALDARAETLCLYEPTEFDPWDDAMFSADMHARHQVLLACAHAILVPTRCIAEESRQGGAPVERLHRLTPSVDLSLFTPAPARARQPGRLHVALVASSVNPRELSYLSSVLQRVPQNLDVQITLSAPLNREAQSMARADRHLRDHVSPRQARHYDDLVPLFQEADAGLVLTGLLPSGHARPRFQAMAEIMASGLAAILPDTPDVRELAPANSALWVKPGDIEGLAGAFRSLTEDERLLENLRVAGRETAMNTFDERTASTKLVSLYEALLTAGAQSTEHTGPVSTPGATIPPDTNAVLRSAWSSVGTRSGKTGEPVTVSQRTLSRPPPTTST